MKDQQSQLRLERLATASLFLLALLLQFWLNWQYRHDPFSTTLVADARSYSVWAERWAAGGSASEPVFHQSPLFPWWLAWTHRLVGEAWRGAAVSATQALLSALAICLWVPLGRRWFGSAPAGIAGGLLALAFAPFHFYALKLLPVATALATQALGMLLLKRADASALRVHSLLAGAVWGIACLARTEMLLLAIPFALWLAMRSGGHLDPRRAAAFLLGLACLIAPATMHNIKSGDRVLIASSAGENLFIGNQRGASGGHHPIASMAGDLLSQRSAATAIAEESLAREARPSEVSSFWTERALEEIAADPLGWSVLLGRKALRVLHPGDPTDLYSLPLERRLYLPLLYLMPVSSWTLLLLGLGGLWVAWRRDRTRAWPILFWIAANAVVLLVFFANARLRLPLMFSLCGPAGLAAAWLFSRPGKRRLLGAGVVIVTVAAGLVMTGERPRDLVRLASVLSIQQRLDASLEVLEDELARPHPDPLVLDQAGWVLQKQGRLERASLLYLQALEGELPKTRVCQTRTRLARVLERLGDLTGARTQHDLAASSRLADAGTFHERGMFLARRGLRDPAIADFKQALRLDPSYPAPAEALRQLGVEPRSRSRTQAESP